MPDGPPARPSDEEPLLKIAARRAVRAARREAATPAFGRLLAYQAAAAAGDVVVALALVGSLFFSVPDAAARERVLLYLLLTVAPFAIVTPLLARVLDRHRGGLRFALVVAAAGRAGLAWLLGSRLDSLYLFPIAFGLLVLSRGALVVRGAVLPHVIPSSRGLVAANASLSKAAAIGGMLAVPPGLAVAKLQGSAGTLTLAAALYLVGLVPAMRLPRARGTRSQSETTSARAGARSQEMRQAVFAVAGMRACTGFLVFHLAFALRRDDLGSIALGVLYGSAATGGLFGALAAPRLRRGLREEGILVVSLALAGLAGVVAGRWFSVPAASALVFFFGMASGASKVAFDSLVQRELPEGGRGWAFARFESILQLFWVVGALPPVVVAVPGGAGVVIAGGVAAGLAGLYTYGRHRVRLGRVP